MFKIPGKAGIVALALTLFMGVATSFPAAAQNSQSTLREDITKATAGHKLTADELTRMSNVVSEIKSHKSDYDLKSKKPKSLDEMVENLNNQPKIKALLSENGFSARDYLITSMTMAHSAVAARVGEDKIPNTDPENVEFVRQHQDAVDALMRTRR
ncbi:hypothetical protein [Thalassospira mesophila]|uniref:DUF4142 domain-containing protein n=1 Tax=Thalassospira mesophila TaxID=1293891 RepID=A0A1Y2L2J7_9PROT|nr:hypothetical protein [Thalassospira mesophila]OSQ38792.1 hypothetical protein TMES_08375 [Thalassospira mesophila]